MTYYINIGDFTQNNITYSNRCLSAATIGAGIETDTIPWEETEHNPWDYKFEDGNFVLDVIPDPEPAEPEPSQLDRVEAQATYTAMMTDTLLEG